MSKIDLSQLKPVETRALIVLMTRVAPLTAKQLREAGAELKSGNHQRLSTLGLIDVKKSGQSNVFELTDLGWQALREPYASDPEAGAGRFLISLLISLQRSLDHRKLSHGEFFQVDEAASDGEVVQPSTADVGVKGAKDVKARIRAAYGSLPKGPGGFVGLADLRDELGDLNREAVDHALRQMSRERDVHISPVANRKSLTKRDREAVLLIGEDENFMISIGAL
jgi:hypothetical protein